VNEDYPYHLSQRKDGFNKMMIIKIIL